MSQIGSHLKAMSFACLGGIAAFNAWAGPDDCKAEVKFVSAVPKGKDTVVSFTVKTSCQASQGRFAYTYDSERGKATPRNVPMWKASNGSSFTWTDDILGTSGVTNVKVQEGSIESTRL